MCPHAFNKSWMSSLKPVQLQKWLKTLNDRTVPHIHTCEDMISTPVRCLNLDVKRVGKGTKKTAREWMVRITPQVVTLVCTHTYSWIDVWRSFTWIWSHHISTVLSKNSDQQPWIYKWTLRKNWGLLLCFLFIYSTLKSEKLIDLQWIAMENG